MAAQRWPSGDWDLPARRARLEVLEDLETVSSPLEGRSVPVRLLAHSLMSTSLGGSAELSSPGSFMPGGLRQFPVCAEPRKALRLQACHFSSADGTARIQRPPHGGMGHLRFVAHEDTFWDESTNGARAALGHVCAGLDFRLRLEHLASGRLVVFRGGLLDGVPCHVTTR